MQREPFGEAGRALAEAAFVRGDVFEGGGGGLVFGLPGRERGEDGFVVPGCCGGNIGARISFSAIWSASCRSSGVKSIRSSSLMPWRSNAGGFVGNGWVGDSFSPATVVR